MWQLKEMFEKTPQKQSETMSEDAETTREKAMDNDIPLVCLHCRTALSRDTDTLTCPSCPAEWPVRGGVPSFTKESFYWSENEKHEMDTLLEAAQARGWRAALLEEFHPKSPQAYVTAMDPRRADWSFLLPLTRESTVLDIGCGWGAVSFALARTCRAVAAIDATWERVHFLDIRRRQEGVENIYPVHGGETLEFPFPNESFDAAAMVGVLEWAGASHTGLRPQQAQTTLLRNVRALLKPGGYLYIGIENRFGYQYWMGSPDHNGVRYVSLLPRSLANAISLRRTGQPYTNYQYSKGGYRRLLRRAGFSDVQFCAPIPQYRHPKFYLPLEAGGALRYFLAGEFASMALEESVWMREHPRAAAVCSAICQTVRRVRLTRLLGWFTPGFSILARR